MDHCSSPPPSTAVSVVHPSVAFAKAALDASSCGELAPMIPALRARARRLCGDESASDDLVQETLMRALEAETSFESTGHLRAWLYTVMKNAFLSRCRRDSVARRVLTDLDRDSVTWLRPEAPPEAPFLIRSVQRALADLPLAFARVVQLVDLQDHGYRDAAQLLDIPVGTVMSRLFRGRRLLAQRLEMSG